MKNTYLILILVLAAACTKERSTEPTHPDGTAAWELIGSDLPGPVTALCVADQQLVAATVDGSPGQPTAVL